MAILPSNTKLLPRDPKEHYETPVELAAMQVAILPHKFHPKVALDAGSGRGVYGRVLDAKYSKAIVLGVDRYRYPLHKSYSNYDAVYKENFIGLSEQDHWKFMTDNKPRPDLIIGNPPYGDVWDQKQRALKKMLEAKGEKFIITPRPKNEPFSDAEAFIREAMALLKPGGYLSFLLRLNFLAGQDRGSKLWVEYIPTDVHVLPQRVSFYGNGRSDDTEYAIYVWHKDHNPVAPALHWLFWR